ncbi:MAG: sialidase family protein [Vicinamibacterales bacterium]
MTATVALGLSAGGGMSGQTTRGSEASPGEATLGVAGAVNATPALTTAGRNIAAVWTATKDGATNVYLATSDNGGATFSEPTRVNDQNGDATANNEQPPRVVMTGAGSRTLTVFWSKRNEGPQKMRRDAIRMARSTDRGRTFSPARLAHDSEVSGARGWESLATGAGGVVHAVWLDGRDAEKKMAAHSGMPHKGQPPQDIYHATIAPDGRMSEHVIATGVCFCCKTAVAVDARGAVYAAWRHIFPGSMRDIAFARSTDGGKYFSPLVRVSEDKWELNGCPEDGPSLAVDTQGVIHVAWGTVVNDGEPVKALFYATSRDGKTFSPRARVPVDTASTPGHPQLTLTPDGGAAIVWDEVAAGLRRVSFTRVSRAGVFRPAQVLSTVESASNPVLVRSGETFLVAWTSRSSSGNASDPAQIKIRRVSAS